MTAVDFNDSGTCLGKVRQMLGAMREQLRNEDAIHGEVKVSILVQCGERAAKLDA